MLHVYMGVGVAGVLTGEYGTCRCQKRASDALVIISGCVQTEVGTRNKVWVLCDIMTCS